MHSSICRFLGVIALITVSLQGLANANAPTGRFVPTGSGSTATVFDTMTQLTWQREIDATTYYTVAQADTYCAGIGAVLGGTGWRVPTAKELQTLVDYAGTTGLLLDPTAFPQSLAPWATEPAYPFWASTPAVYAPNYVWFVDFGRGSVYSMGRWEALYVRCVR